MTAKKFGNLFSSAQPIDFKGTRISLTKATVQLDDIVVRAPKIQVGADSGRTHPRGIIVLPACTACAKRRPPQASAEENNEKTRRRIIEVLHPTEQTPGQVNNHRTHGRTVPPC